MSDNPAGWHPDPVGRHEHRYWDGERWTEHVADQGNMGTDPLEAAASPEQVAAPVGPSLVNLPAIPAAGRPVEATPATQTPATAPVSAEPLAADPGPQPAADPEPQPAAAATPAASPPAHRDIPGGEHIATAEAFAKRAVPAGMAWKLVAGAAGVLLLSLFLPWYTVSADIGGFESPSVSANAFESLSLIDIILLILGAGSLAIALEVLTGRDLMPALPPIAVPAAGALATVLILYRLLFTGIDAPDGVDIGRGFGIFLGFLAAIALTVGALAAKRE